MRIKLCLLITVAFILNLSCQTSQKITNKKVPDNVIAMIADEPVIIDELKINYNRNRNTEEIDSSAIHEFYPSYINYRLKLYEGYQQEFHKDSTILAEFNQFASEIANRYWIENEIKRKRIETFTKRFEFELKSFHILKELPEDALPSDTARVYNNLISVRDSLMKGASPEEMNERHSSIREGRPVGGPLYWITAGITIEPFEEALYQLEPGDISFPVRSRFGYHIILLQEKRKRTPQRRVKHIFVRKTEDGSGKQKINQANQALSADSSWSEVLQVYTEDTSTKNGDGALGWVGYGTRYPLELVEFAIQTSIDSKYSEPYEASYGYHIMKVDSVRTFESDEEKKEYIIERLDELGRLNPNQNDVYNRVARESNLIINWENFSEFFKRQKADTLIQQEEFQLIELNNQTFTTSDFQFWLDNYTSVDKVMNSGNLIESYRNYLIQQNLVELTRNQFPEFGKQVDHFLEGLIVFKVNEENIWNLDTIKRSDLRTFYKSNHTNYRKGKTFLYTEISAASKSLMQSVHNEFSKGISVNEISEHFDDIAIRQDSIHNQQNRAYSILSTLEPGEFSEPISVDDSVLIYLVNSINEERLLSFNEAYDRVFSDYQPIREENYINQLKMKYNLKLYPENLY